jgi:hypothetical protein
MVTNGKYFWGILCYIYTCMETYCASNKPNYGNRLDKLNLINFMFHCILCYFCVKFAICLEEHVIFSACWNRSIVNCSPRSWISGCLHLMVCLVCNDILEKPAEAFFRMTEFGSGGCWSIVHGVQTQKTLIWVMPAIIIRTLIKMFLVWVQFPIWCGASIVVHCIMPQFHLFINGMDFLLMWINKQSLGAAEIFTRTCTIDMEDI